MNLLQHNTGFGDPQSCASILLGDQRGQIARLGERLYKLLWVGVFSIQLPPVSVRKSPAQFAHGASDIRVQFGISLSGSHGGRLMYPYLPAATPSVNSLNPGASAHSSIAMERGA